MGMNWKKGLKIVFSGAWIICVALAVGIMLPQMFILLLLTSKPNPRRLAKSAASLIPYISEIRPFVEENWERMDEVRLIEREHEESEEPLTEEEEALYSALFTEECPFTYVRRNCFYTGYESDVGSARLYVMYLPDSEWDEWNGTRWLEAIYYMEELAPEWYACTEPIWNASNTPISFNDLRAEREDGGRVFLPGHDPQGD